MHAIAIHTTAPITYKEIGAKVTIKKIVKAIVAITAIAYNKNFRTDFRKSKSNPMTIIITISAIM